jgi:hypothetical protein
MTSLSWIWGDMVEWYMRYEVFKWRSISFMGTWYLDGGVIGSCFYEGFSYIPFSFARWTSQGCCDGADELLFTCALLAGRSYTPQ